jgi:hypothetical protein
MIHQIAERDLPNGLIALTGHSISAGRYVLRALVRPGDWEHVVCYVAINSSMSHRAEFLVSPASVDEFASHTGLFAIAAMNYYGALMRREEYVAESARVGYYFFTGRYAEGFRALGRSWLEAFQSPTWYAQAAVATAAATSAVGRGAAATEAVGAVETTGVRIAPGVAAEAQAEAAAAQGTRVRVAPEIAADEVEATGPQTTTPPRLNNR